MHQVMRRESSGVDLPVVTYLRKFGVLAMVFTALLTPTMACMVPDAPMTSEERACCQMMKNHCGEKGMPASHGCCKKIPESLYDNALNAKAVTLHPVVVPVIWLPALHVGNPTSS